MSNKKGTPSKEISDTANNKILELEQELARQKTEDDRKTAELNELVRQGIDKDKELARQGIEKDKETGELKELARQQNEENQRLQAQIAEMIMNMNNSSSNITTPQVLLPPIPCVSTYPTTMSTPTGIWGLTETATPGDKPDDTQPDENYATYRGALFGLFRQHVRAQQAEDGSSKADRAAETTAEMRKRGSQGCFSLWTHPGSKKTTYSG